MRPITREEALAIYHAGPEAVVKVICELSAQVVALGKQVAFLEQRVKTLEEQLSKNSHNSSKPPSSDGLAGKPYSNRTPSERKTGGQEGHPGSTLQAVAKPDHVERHSVHKCQECRFSLSSVKPSDIEKRQVFDIPPVKLAVTEHQAETKCCPSCGHVNKAEFPQGIYAPVQYGSHVKAAVTYLKGYQLLPLERTTELLRDLFSLNISEGTLDNILCDASKRLEPIEDQIKEQLRGASVAHFDETGVSVKGQTNWMHVVGTKQLTHYAIHPKRGTEAMDAIGILPGFHGKAVHDCWSPYFGYDGCDHGLCNAHLLRELTFLFEEQRQDWAKSMIDLLLDIKKSVAEAKGERTSLPRKQRWEFEEQYQGILDSGFAANPAGPPVPRRRGRQKKSKARNMLERLDGHRKEVLAFMYDFNVPFDNNLAERDIRMAKVQQKISGAFRSETGATALCRIRSYISTVRKNSLDVLDAVENIFNAKRLSLPRVV